MHLTNEGPDAWEITGALMFPLLAVLHSTLL